MRDGETSGRQPFQYVEGEKGMVKYVFFIGD